MASDKELAQTEGDNLLRKLNHVWEILIQLNMK